MRDRRFMTRVLLVSFLALVAWLPASPAQSDDPSPGTSVSTDESAIRPEASQPDMASEPIPVQREAPTGELQRDSEREMSVPEPGGPTFYDMEMRREQDTAASVAF